MVPALSCSDLTERSVAYAWGALEAEERAAVEGHRAVCASCDAHLAAAERLVGRLDEALPRIEPPPQLRARVLATVADATRLGAGSAESPGRAASRQVGRPPESELVAGRPGRRLLGWLGGQVVGPALGGAAAGVLVALVAWAAVVRPYYDAQLAAVRAELAQLQEHQAAGERIESTLRSATTRTLPLTAPGGAGRGTLWLDLDRGWGMLAVQTLDAAPTGREYQVWLAGAGGRTLLGSFNLDADGTGYFVLPDPLPDANPERIDIIGAPASRPEIDEVAFTVRL